mmetsp:Transcript_9348/g.10903  ORF Transcript_9348/g.10903 Transcript_9348/m.10903 type:complete len:265 (-) Transcript_9348:162-956(-)
MPHLLTTCGQDGLVKFWDVRKGMGLGGVGGSSSLGLIGSTSSSHNYPPSPLKDDQQQHNTNSCGGDGCWTMENPLRTVRGGHTHWSTVVKYNSFHDQLVLSGGTDGMVNLWRISSISSAPMMLDVGGGGGGADGGNVNGGGGGSGDRLEGDGGEEDDLSKFLTYRDQEDGVGGGDGYGADRDNRTNDDRAPPLPTTNNNNNNNTTSNGDGGDKPDVRVTKMELSEAVYDLAWSAADPWIFVSLGFDGSVILNHVPSKEKYKILL